MARVDVIMCTRNSDPTGLSLAMKSLADSGFRDFRLLLVNDSDRPLVGLVGDVPYEVKVIEMGKNVGLSQSLKAADTWIEAEYFARMDCGDEIFPERFALQVECLDRHPECVLVGASSQIYLLRDGKRVDCGISRSSEDVHTIDKWLRRTNPFVHGSLMGRTSVLREVGGYNPAFPVAQDYNLILRMRKFGTLRILPGPLYTHFFKVGTSTTLVKNKLSIRSGMKSRFQLLPIRDLVTIEFLSGFVRDVILLLLPSGLVTRIRFQTLKRRLEKNVAG